LEPEANIKNVSSNMFSTSLLEPASRTRVYRKWLRPFARVCPHDDTPTKAFIAWYDLGQMVIANSTSSPARYLREPSAGTRNEFTDYMLLRLLQRGEIQGNFGGHVNLEIHEGDIYLFDLSQSVDLLVKNSKHVDLLFPRKLLGDVGTTMHGRVLRKEWLPCRMLTQHLLRLITVLPLLDASRSHAIAQATLAVLRRCLNIASREQEDQLWMEAMQERMLTYIDAHLDDSELNATMLQRKFRISRTHLYRLFAELGGVQHCIRERRLEAAFRSLCEHPDRNISEIIFRLGFSNERQFQRSFRSRYGMTASAARYR
jgi:AraC-like DNA-binding protein